MKENIRMLGKLFRNSPSYVTGYFMNQILLSLPSYLVNVLFLKMAVDSIAQGRAERLLWYLAAMSLFLMLSDLYSSYFNQIVRPVAEEKNAALFTERLRRTAMEAPIECYDRPDFRDDISYLSKRALTISDTVLEHFSKMAAGVVNLCLTLGMLRSIGTELLLFAAVSVAVSFVYSKLAAGLRYRIRIETVPHERRRSYFVGLFFRRDCVKERRLSRIDDLFAAKAQEASEDLRRVHEREGGKLAFYSFMKEFVPGTLILNFGLLAFLLYKAVAERSLGMGEFVAAFNGINVIVSSAAYLFGRCLADIRESQIDIRKMEQFHELYGSEAEKQEDPKKERHPDKAAPRKIELRRVCFSYPGMQEPALQDIDLTLEPGKKTAIVGRNGSGKSTLTYLIMGFYKPQSGQILVGRSDIGKDGFDLCAYRHSFISFFQNETPWPVTVAENVALDIHYDESRVVEVLQRSGLACGREELAGRLVGKEFDRGGIMLSGGEMQKLMLAHCFYENKPYLIMDEPSSALDPSAEAWFNSQIYGLPGEATVLFVSHRLSTVEMADYIYVIDGGRIVQRGTHGELRRQEGLYREMWEQVSHGQ